MIKQEDLEKYVLDPINIQYDILDMIDKDTEGNLGVVSATNPFMMLMETATVTSANASLEAKAVIRSKHPSLAVKPSELYHHLSDKELVNIFAIPSLANIIFNINVMNLRNAGYRPENTNYVVTVLPMYSEVIVSNTTFTLLNDISIKLYDDNTVFVEHINNDHEISIKDIGVLRSGIITDAENVEWIVFETYLKQIKRTVAHQPVINVAGFNKKLDLSEQYYYSNVFYKNSVTPPEGVKIQNRHNEEYIDETTPSVYIDLSDTNVEYKIPSVYLINNMISGNVFIELFETRGNIYLPLNKFNTQDFKIVMGDTSKSPASATITNIAVLANSRDVVNGGKNSATLEELKNSIIHNTTGVNNLPITEHEVAAKANQYGYEIFKELDILTSRMFIASKNTPSIDNGLIHSRMDIFFNTVGIVISEVNSRDINFVNNDLVIRSGTLFREDNGKVSVVNDNEKDLVIGLNSEELIQKLNNNNYFFNPYYYIIDTDINNTTTRVYDLDKPLITNFRIEDKNNNIKQNVNTDKFIVVKTNTGYKVVISLIANDAFNTLLPTSIKGELKIQINETDLFVSFLGEFDPNTGYIEFNIETNHYVNNENCLGIINGISVVSNKDVKLIANCELYLYTTDASVVDETNRFRNNITTSNSDHLVVMTKEFMNIEFGKEIKYIYNKLYSAYTERKYKKYTYDIFETYQEDVYEINEETGTEIFITEDENGKKKITKHLLHSEGSYVLDNDGNKVVKYRKGTIMVDDQGLPIIDQEAGVVRYIDILMLDYKYKVSNSLIYKNYLISVLDMLNGILFKDMELINNNLLENTVVNYKSFKTTGNVDIKSNNLIRSIRYKVVPKVILYVKSTMDTSDDHMDKIKTTIGMILHKHFDTTSIKLREIKDEILNTLNDEVMAVNIENIDPNSKSEIMYINDNSKRLVLDKKLVTNKNQELVVKYNIDLELETV